MSGGRRPTWGWGPHEPPGPPVPRRDHCKPDKLRPVAQGGAPRLSPKHSAPVTPNWVGTVRPVRPHSESTQDTRGRLCVRFDQRMSANQTGVYIMCQTSVQRHSATTCKPFLRRSSQSTAHAPPAPTTPPRPPNPPPPLLPQKKQQESRIPQLSQAARETTQQDNPGNQVSEVQVLGLNPKP